MSILDGIIAAGEPPDSEEFLAPDEGFSTEFPGLYEFLARIKHAGADRRPGRLVVYYENGRACVCLSDAHTRQVGFHVDDSVQACLEGVEGRLQAGKIDWRKSRKYQG